MTLLDESLVLSRKRSYSSNCWDLLPKPMRQTTKQSFQVAWILFSEFSDYFNQVHNKDMKPDQKGYCIIHIFTAAVVLTCSTYFMVFMTFERFYSIVRPHKAASFNTVKRAKITIVCIVTYSLVASVPHFFITENDDRNCMSVFSNTPRIIYYWWSTLSAFLVPFISLLTMNCVIIYTLRQRSRHSLTGSKGQGQTQGQGAIDKHLERQIYVMLLLVTFGFLVLTTPIYIIILWQALYFQPTAQMFATSYLLFAIGEKTYFTNNGINFFLYVMSGQRFRTDLKKLFSCSKRKSHDSGSLKFSDLTTAVSNVSLGR